MNASRKIKTLGLFLGFFTVFSLGSLSALELDLEVPVQLGLVYNGEPSFAFGGTEVSLALSDTLGPGRWIAGIEAGFTEIGSQVLFPLGYQFSLLKNGEFSLEAGASLLPGLALFNPAPLFLFAAKADLEGTWWFKENMGLSLSLGGRYTTCPYYTQYIATYETWDLDLGLGLRFSL